MDTHPRLALFSGESPLFSAHASLPRLFFFFRLPRSSFAFIGTHSRYTLYTIAKAQNPFLLSLCSVISSYSARIQLQYMTTMITRALTFYTI